MPNQVNLAQLTQILHQQFALLVDQYQVESLGVFGSYVRDEQSSNSDLDLLVTFHEPPSLLRFIELENYLSDLLGVKVDLVMKDALKPRIGERILKKVVTV
jgi:predicted nucleotidyltransferase